jgi:hypothetical protein
VLLALARDRRDEARKVADGIDPSAVRKVEQVSLAHSFQ